MAARVLVADADREVRELLIRTLTELGSFQCVEAANGAEALRILRTEKIDLVFTDSNLPAVSGMVLLQHMKRMWLSTPVVMISERRTRADVLEAIAAGVTYYIAKPLEKEHIRRAIGAVGAIPTSDNTARRQVA